MTPTDLEYLEDHGPGIPELPEGAPSPDGAAGVVEPPQFPGWEQDTIEQFLRGTGAGIHMLIGAAESDWKMTRADLDRIAPPLTRIANRWEPALRLSPLADPFLVAHGFALYGWRSALERQRALRDREESPAPRYEHGEEEHEPIQQTEEEELPTHEPYFPREEQSE
jgi:hypothetical protein